MLSAIAFPQGGVCGGGRGAGPGPGPCVAVKRWQVRVSVNNAVMKWQRGRAEHARELPVGGGEPER